MVDIVKDVFSTVTDRIKGKFIGAFIISWLAWNWKVVYVTLFVSEIYTGTSNKIEYIKCLDIKWLDGLLIPMLIAVFYIVLIPFLNRGADIIINKHRQAHKEYIAKKNKESLYTYNDLQKKINPLKERIEILSKDLDDSERDLIRKDKAYQKLVDDNSNELKIKDERIKNLDTEITKSITEQTKLSEKIANQQKEIQELNTKPTPIVFHTFEVFIENIDLILKIHNNRILHDKTFEYGDLIEYLTKDEIEATRKLGLYEMVENSQMISLDINRFNMYMGMINYIQDFESERVKGLRAINQLFRKYTDLDLPQNDELLNQYYQSAYNIEESFLQAEKIKTNNANKEIKVKKNKDFDFDSLLHGFDEDKRKEIITKAGGKLNTKEKAELKIFDDNYFQKIPDELKLWIGENLNPEPFKNTEFAKHSMLYKYLADMKYINSIKGGYIHFTDEFFVFMLRFIKYLNIDFNKYKPQNSSLDNDIH